MFPRRLHPLQRRKLLKATVFDGNRKDGSAAIPKRSPDIWRHELLFSSRQWGIFSGEAFIILGRYRFCLPFSRTTARNETLGPDDLNSPRLPSATFPFTSFGTELSLSK